MSRRRDYEDIIATVMANGQSTPDNKEARKQRKRHVFKFIILAVLALIAISALISLAIFLLSRNPTSPFDTKLRELQKKAGFTLYIPFKLPSGYILDEGSIKLDNGVIFYTVINGDSNIAVSEQAMPNPPPEIGNIQSNSSVKKIDTAVGSATLGLYRGAPIGVMLTSTTLINISAPSDIPIDQVSEVIQNMNPIN